MPQLSFDVVFEKNTVLFSAQDIRESDFYGIALNAPNYKDIEDDVIESYVKMSTNYFENELSIRVMKQTVTETIDFDRIAFQHWGALRVKNPIGNVIRIKAGLNSAKQEIPLSWAVVKQADRPENRMRMLHFVPINSFFVYVSGTFLMGYYHNNVPNFFEVTYCTGFDKVPDFLMYAIKTLATIPLFNIFGDIVFGAGLASFSLSLDGLSQSLATTNSSTNAGFGARVLNYTKELKTHVDNLIATFKPIAFAVS